MLTKQVLLENPAKMIEVETKDLDQILKDCTDDEIRFLIESAENFQSQYDVSQMTAKILMNSLYGALANRYFPLFNEEIAQAITGAGRYFIQMTANYIEEKLQGIHKSEKPYIVYGDTDSVIGSTLIKTSKGDVKIEDLYHSVNGDIKLIGVDNFVKYVNDDVKAGSVNNNLEYEENAIKYVMKHKVKKRMYKIKCDGDEVIITEDHSCMVIRDNKLIEIKPKDILKTDKIVKCITVVELFNDFEIEDLGIQEEWVYDIEVENNHNFFGNNILVHNSVYLHIEPFMESYISKNPNQPMNHYVDIANKIEQQLIQPTIQQVIDDFANELNAYNKDVIGCEREVISDSGVFTSKKKYYMSVRDSEGTRFPDDEPKIKVMGMNIAQSGTPKWSKKKLKESIPVIFNSDENGLRQWIKDNKQEFISVPTNDIVNYISSSNLDKELGEKGLSWQARSALVHNKYVKDNGLDDKVNELAAGEKFKHLHLRTPNKFQSDRIGFMSDVIIRELEDSNAIDYDTQYEKQFLNMLDLMVKSLGYNVYKLTDDVTDDW